MKQLAIWLLLLSIVGSTFAEDTPPASGLGQQVPEEPPTVVYPATTDIVSEQMQEFKDFQLNEDQMNLLKEVFLKRQRILATPYVDQPKPVTRTLPINLDPGTTPPVIRLASGQLSTIVFSDLSGNPWYISKIKFNKKQFSDGKKEESNSSDAIPTNILTLEPNAPANYGNVSVELRGLATPVILILTSGQQEVDMRVDAKIPGKNPDAVVNIALTNLPTIDNALGYFLDGVPPADAKRLKVRGALDDVEAWAYKEYMYVRTKGDAQYPAYIGAARSTSGVAVYRYAGIKSALTFTTGGQAITVFIE